MLSKLTSWFSRLSSRFKKVYYPFAVTVLYVVAVPLIALTEIPYISKEDFAPWASFKFIDVLLALPALFITRNRQTTDLAMGLLFFAVCFQVTTSGLYRPLYELGYFQVAMACAFIPTQRKWLFPTIFSIGAVFVATLVYQREFWKIEIEPISNIDMGISVFIFFAIAVIVNSTLTNFRQERSIQMMRLSLLGQHSIQLAHDLKGLLSGPLLHVSALQDRTDEISHAEVKNIISYLKEDLANAGRVLSQMSEMSRTEERVQDIDLKRTVDSTLVLFQRRFANVQVHVDCEGKIKTDPRRFQFILFNALLNCAEQMARSAPSSAKRNIRITCRNGIFIVEDDAGGMSEAIMKAIKSGGSATSKTEGGGLGFQIIQAEARALKLSLKFENTTALGAPGFYLELTGIKATPA